MEYNKKLEKILLIANKVVNIIAVTTNIVSAIICNDINLTLLHLGIAMCFLADYFLLKALEVKNKQIEWRDILLSEIYKEKEVNKCQIEQKMEG